MWESFISSIPACTLPAGVVHHFVEGKWGQLRRISYEGLGQHETAYFQLFLETLASDNTHSNVVESIANQEGPNVYILLDFW